MTKEKIENYIDKCDVAFISSVDSEGFPNTKAMLMPRERVGLNEFYFSTNTSSMRIEQYRKNNKACIYFYKKGKISYFGVMLVGTMEVLEDVELKKKYWEAADRIYYKKGVEDPDYCILKFNASKARWSKDLHTEDIKIG